MDSLSAQEIDALTAQPESPAVEPPGPTPPTEPEQAAPLAQPAPRTNPYSPGSTQHTLFSRLSDEADELDSYASAVGESLRTAAQFPAHAGEAVDHVVALLGTLAIALERWVPEDHRYQVDPQSYDTGTEAAHRIAQALGIRNPELPVIEFRDSAIRFRPLTTADRDWARWRSGQEPSASLPTVKCAVGVDAMGMRRDGSIEWTAAPDVFGVPADLPAKKRRYAGAEAFLVFLSESNDGAFGAAIVEAYAQEVGAKQTPFSASILDPTPTQDDGLTYWRELPIFQRLRQLVNSSQSQGSAAPTSEPLTPSTSEVTTEPDEPPITPSGA